MCAQSSTRLISGEHVCIGRKADVIKALARQVIAMTQSRQARIRFSPVVIQNVNLTLKAAKRPAG